MAGARETSILSSRANVPAKPSARAARARAWLVCLAVVPLGVTLGGVARAEPPRAGALKPASLIEVRLALSKQAAARLLESRVHRLLAFELDGRAVVTTEPAGPLGDSVAQVWVELASEKTVIVEVRLAERPAMRRAIAISGLVPDVAARLVALTAAEAIRDQARPLRGRRSPQPRPPSAAELERASRDRLAVGLDASLSGAALPAAEGALLGPALSVSFRAASAGVHVFGRYLGGSAEAGRLRWLEAGLAADYRLWLSPSLRLAAGAVASGASLRLGSATAVDAIADATDTWSARAGALVGAELHLAGPAWLGLSIEPSAILRPVPYAIGQRAGAIEGAFIGANLTLTIERRSAAN